MTATLSRRIRANCPGCGVLHFLRPVEVNRPLECDACGTSFVVRRGTARHRGAHNLRSRSMEDLSVGSGRPSRPELTTVCRGALALVILLGLILLLSGGDWSSLTQAFRDLLE